MIRLYLHRDKDHNPVSIHELNRYQIFPASRRPAGWSTKTFVDVITGIHNNEKYFQFCDWSADIPIDQQNYYLMHYGSVQDIYENRGFITLPPQIRDQINNGSLTLLIVFVWETFDLNETISQWQQRFCTLLTEIGIIRTDSVKVLVGSYSLSNQHRDSRVSWLFYPWFEAALQSESYRRYESMPANDLLAAKKYKFLSLNRAPRTHRHVLIAFLEYLRVSHHGYISWPGWHDRLFPELNHLNIFSLGIKHYPQFEQHVLSTKKIIGDYHDSDDGRPHWLDIDQLYQSVEFEIVNETHYHNTGNLLFLTEKTFRPISLGLPFLLLSSPGSLELLCRLGYQTFPSMFNESYDREASPMRAIESIAQQVFNVCQKPKTLTPMVIESVRHNQKHFWEKQHALALHDLLTHAKSKT